MTIKISISLADETLDVLDRFMAQHNFSSRSAAIQEAIRRLAPVDLTADYARAAQEWAESGEEELWDQAVGDGLR